MGRQLPKVSFVIPCYNHEKYLESFFLSILSQTYSNYEILICDDASKDLSVSVIKSMIPEFEKQGVRFVLLQNENNCGITVTLNKLLPYVEGELVKVIASDDMLHEKYLEEMVKIFSEDKEIKLLFSNGYRVNEKSAFPIDDSMLLGEFFTEEPICDGNVLSRIYQLNFVPAPSLMIDGTVFDELGYYDENIAIEDLEMILRVLSKYPNSLKTCNKHLVYYRMSANSISSMTFNSGLMRRQRFMYENSIKIVEKYKENVPASIYRKTRKKLKTDYLYCLARYKLSSLFKRKR